MLNIPWLFSFFLETRISSDLGRATNNGQPIGSLLNTVGKNRYPGGPVAPYRQPRKFWWRSPYYGLLLKIKDEDDCYHCPVINCNHPGFTSKWECRKHIDNIHPWYFYFDKKPLRDMSNENTSTSSTQDLKKENMHDLHAFLSCELGSGTRVFVAYCYLW